MKLSFVERCRGMVEQGVRELWPDVPCEVVLRPSSDLTVGDLTSDCCMQLSRRLREPPERLGRRLIAALPAAFPGSCEIAHDFLNVRLRTIEAPWEEGLQKGALPRLAIILPEAPDAGSASEYLRLGARALAQCLCAQAYGAEYTLYVGPSARACGETGLPLDEIFRDLVAAWRTGKPAPSELLAEQVTDVMDREEGSRICVWLTPASLEKKIFNRFYHARIRGAGRAVLRCPDHAALSGADALCLEAAWTGWRQGELASLCLYLSGAADDNDVDLAVPRLPESGNLLWFMRSVRARVERIYAQGRSSIDGVAVPALAEQSPVLRTLIVRSFFLQQFLGQAAADGSVPEYLSVLEDLLRTTVRVFNEPMFRVRQSRGQTSQGENEIMAGVLRVLSDTIAYWRPWIDGAAV